MSRWYTKWFGRHIELKERLLRIILSVGMVALSLGFIISAVVGSGPMLLLVLALVTCVLAALLWQVLRYHRVELGIYIIEILVNFLVFPVAFFFSGGIEGGATVWFVVGILFTFLLIKGKKFWVFLFCTIVCYISCYVVGYLYPEWILPLSSREDVYLDSLVAVIVVSLIGGALMKFQNRVFEQEQEKTKQQQEELKELADSKSAFFANMSHEIRTPINTIIGLNEMTLREEISDEVAENAVNIQHASKMLLTLINDILDLSKMESGKMEIVPVQYETGTLFSDLVNIIWVRAKEKNLELKINIDPTIPSMLFGDEVRIKQVITNLLSNAVKYTPQGMVTLEANSERLDSNTVRLRISVEDTGMGIRKEEMKDLFEAFRRVDQTKNRKIEGTGLGLPITKQLVEMMGGTIMVDSIYRKGSTFTVVLEQKIVDAKPMGERSFMVKKQMVGRERYRQRFEAPEARVLVVDDNEMNLMVATKLLRGTKVQVETAKSGAECLLMTRNKHYHAILMDHVMPEMDGKETMQRIRKQNNGQCNETPIIALTANAMSGAEEQYQQMGFEGYLAKPISGSLLEATLLRYLPAELVEYDAAVEEEEALMWQNGKKKRQVMITTECSADIPRIWKNELGIGIQTSYINTSYGRFCDVDEVATENVLSYLNAGNKAYTEPASVEEFEKFFSDALAEAETVIHISVSSHIAKAYSHAVEAAKGFDNVHVVDSMHVSSGMGIEAMFAARLAKEGKSAEYILEILENLRHRVNTSFVVVTTESLYLNNRLSRRISNLCENLNLRPVISVIQGKMKVTGIKVGSAEQAYKSYIREQLKNKKKIDKRILVITHAGCTVKQQELILAEVKKYMEFDNVIFQKACATISSNCGLGCFGLLFMRKS